MNTPNCLPTRSLGALSHFILGLIALLPAVCLYSAQAPANFNPENLVAWCIAHRWDASDRSPAERAKMVSDLGIGRVAYNWRAQDNPDFEEEIRQYQEHGIEFFAFWNESEEAFALFQQYGLRPQIWKVNPSPKAETQGERVSAAARRMLPFARRAREIGSSFGLYNHGNWGGQPANLVAVCEELHQLGCTNVGIVYNFHHAHHEMADWKESLELMMPYLLCVNLNGMIDPEGADLKDLTQKIRPIGSGPYEAGMIRTLAASGYEGPIGILDHRPDLDARVALHRNLQGLSAILSAQPAPDGLLGDWSLEMESGLPAWMRLVESGGEIQAYLRLYVGPAGPYSPVEVNDGRLQFEMVRNRRNAPTTRRSVDVGLRDGELDGVMETHQPDGGTERETFSGTKIPPMPATPPDLSRVRFGHPIALFNGMDLTGWRAHEPDKLFGWSVEEGVLVNNTPKTDFSATGAYANLRTEAVFDDFWLHLEFLVGKDRNSGVYLRGMYEAQVVDRDSRMQGLQGVGAIFGAIEPAFNAGRPGGEWQTYDITLVDRHVTVVLNGEKVIDNQPISAPTAGAVFTNPAEPGPIYLQGDHTAVAYRNIYLAPVVKE